MMKKPSVTYRFFCALTACTVLLSVSIPVGLHARDLAELCYMKMMKHEAIPMSKAGHSGWDTNHHKTKHDAANLDARTDAESCPLDFTCCSTGTTAFKASAVPALFKVFAGYIPVLIQILNASPDPEYIKSAEQVFASLYSPPLFLKNSSFLN